MIPKTHIKLTSSAANFEQALNEIFASLKPYKGKAFKLTAFVNSENISDYINKKNLVAAAIASCFENEIPTWSLLSEAPMNATLCVELICSDAEKKFINFQLRSAEVIPPSDYNGRLYLPSQAKPANNTATEAGASAERG